MNTQIFRATTTGTSPSVVWTGFSSTALTVTGTGTKALALVDLDNSTRPDLVVAATGGDHVHLNLGLSTAATPAWLGFKTTAVTITGGAASSTALAVGDVNGDGLADVVAASATGAPVVYYNPGTAVAHRRCARQGGPRGHTHHRRRHRCRPQRPRRRR